MFRPLLGKASSLLTLLLLIGLVSCGTEADTEADANKTEELASGNSFVRAIKPFTVISTESRRSRRLSGYLQAVDSSELSFAVAGQVLEVNVKPGDKVEKGYLLAKLDAQPYVLQLQTAAAELQQAKAQLKEKTEQFQSKKRIYEKRYISKNDFEQSQAAYEVALSSVELAQSRLRLERRNLEKTELHAPFAGTITQRLIEPFQDVSAAKVVIEMQGGSEVEVSIQVPSRLVDSFEIGNKVTVAVPALGDYGLEGTVSERGIKASSRGTFPMVITLAEPIPGALSGMAAEITLEEIIGQDQLLIPNSAMAIDEFGNSYVMIYLPESGLVKKRPVRYVQLDLNRLEILEGLKANDIIAAAGVELLRDGQQVNLFQGAYRPSNLGSVNDNFKAGQ